MEVLLATLRLKIYVNIGINMSEQPLIINDGRLSGPTDSDGLRLFIVLMTSAAETGSVGKCLS
jgi:hypothetical protein